MIIRLWEKEDLPRLQVVEEECFSDPYTIAMLEGEFHCASTTYFVLEEDGEILGYGGYSAVLDEADIMTIGVLPKVQRHGFGRALLNQLLESMREKGIKTAYLEVRISNTPAITLYKDSGFQEIGIRKGYYADNGEDALTMMKEI